MRLGIKYININNTRAYFNGSNRTQQLLREVAWGGADHDVHDGEIYKSKEWRRIGDDWHAANDGSQSDSVGRWQRPRTRLKHRAYGIANIAGGNPV